MHTRMFQRIHPFTSLAVLITLGSAAFLFTDLTLVGVGMLVLAHVFVLLEFKKYTSNYQFVMVLSTAVGLGIALDLEHSTWPCLTMALLLAGSATIARQAFMQQFTYVNLLWLDSGASVVAFTLYLVAATMSGFAWDILLAPLAPMIFATGLTCGYVHDARQMKSRLRFGYKVQVGMEARDFELPDQDGQLVRLSDYRGKHPVLLIFVRGDWCPGCHMMLRTYERERRRFQERGVHVVAVGPDNIEVNRDMVQRIGVGYRMLSDDAQQVSGHYGVVYNNPLLELGIDSAEGVPLPASFLVDVDGVVRYVSRPDRVGEFLDPTLIFGVLDKIPQAPQPAWT